MTTPANATAEATHHVTAISEFADMLRLFGPLVANGRTLTAKNLDFALATIERDRLARTDSDTAPSVLTWPDELTPALTEILGRPNFSFIQLSRLYRDAGVVLPEKSEDEQAFFMHRMLCHWFEHAEAWSDAMQKEVEEKVAQVRGRFAEGGTA